MRFSNEIFQLDTFVVVPCLSIDVLRTSPGGHGFDTVVHCFPDKVFNPVSKKLFIFVRDHDKIHE